MADEDTQAQAADEPSTADKPKAKRATRPKPARLDQCEVCGRRVVDGPCPHCGHRGTTT